MRCERGLKTLFLVGDFEKKECERHFDCAQSKSRIPLPTAVCVPIVSSFPIPQTKVSSVSSAPISH